MLEVNLWHGFVAQERHDNVRGANQFFDVGEREAFEDRFRLFFGAGLVDDDIHAAVAKVECYGATHVAKTDDTDPFPLKDAEIAIFIVINDCHAL